VDAAGLKGIQVIQSLPNTLYDRLETEDEVALFLSRPLASLLLNHQREAMRRDYFYQTVSPTASVCAVTCIVIMPAGLATFAPTVCSRLYLYWNLLADIDMETERQYVGFLLMADAGFDPTAAARIHRQLS